MSMVWSYMRDRVIGEFSRIVCADGVSDAGVLVAFSGVIYMI